jgi:hypothetical protein
MPNQNAPTSPRHRGWYFDQVNNALEAYVNGTRILSATASAITIDLAQTISAAPEYASAVGVADDISVELGTDDDSVIRHRTGTLAANTTLTDVLTGTPVSAALAANSLMISNNTANGDIAVYVNTGTVSEQAIFIDGSAKQVALGQTGWNVNIVEAAVRLTLGTVTVFGTTQPTNTIVFKTGTAPAGTITTSGGLFTDGTTIKKIIADGTVSDVQT